MPRVVIAAVVAVVIAALAAIALFVTSANLDDKVKRDAHNQAQRAYQVIGQLAQLEAIDVQNKAERLAAEPSFAAALKASENPGERQHQARLGFTKFTANDKEGEVLPDIIALVSAEGNGNLIAMNDVASVIAKQWKDDKGNNILPAIDAVLGGKVIISDVWYYQDRMMKVGVAPIIDPNQAAPANDPDGVTIIGAVVVAYAQTAKEAQNDKALLGADVAYYSGPTVVATSFTSSGGGTEEDTSKAKQLSDFLKTGKIPQTMDVQKVTIGGTDYYASSVPMPRAFTNSKRIPSTYPPVTAGAVVLSPIVESGNSSSTIKLAILLLGGGALALAMLGLYLSNRRLIAQIDQVELGVTDIISGNLDRTFRPVGPELDGLSNGLNVMLARLLGRPEPGEEEFDDDGNPIVPGRVEFDEGDEQQSKAADPDLAALAQEAEPDYYKRVYTEYQSARKSVGQPDDVSFENFIAKLKVNEGKLKAQYQCRAVRFRVVTKDNKVSLKPVPIFA